MRAPFRKKKQKEEKSREQLDSVLFYAAEHYGADEIRDLLEAGADINTRTDVGETPLMRAIWSKNDITALALIEAGADPNVQLYERKSSVLHFAAWRQNEPVTVALIQHGARTNVRNADGQTPAEFCPEMAPLLTRTVSERHAKKVRLTRRRLLRHG